MNYKRYKLIDIAKSIHAAFTLAEVLIVLGIIGIVAELTIPTLVQNTQEKVTVTTLKKSYSMLSQAYTMAVQENGTPDSWGLSADGPGALNIMAKFSPYLKITKNCQTGTGCTPATGYKYLNGGTSIDSESITVASKAILSDGTTLWIQSYNDCSKNDGDTIALKNICGYFYIDVNGLKKPNQYGHDWFSFWITQNGGIVPLGTTAETTAGAQDFAANCLASNAAGYSCAAWVIYNENMGYLHCSDLAWGVKTKCN